jgi:phage tail-like protein
MAEQKDDFLVSTSFTINIEGLPDCIWDSVDGIRLETEDIRYVEGQNQVTNRPGRVEAGNITLRRRFRKDPSLYNWIKEIKDGKKTRKAGTIFVHEDDGTKIFEFTFTNAFPKVWIAPTFTKEVGGANTLIETVVLSVSDVEMKTT